MVEQHVFSFEKKSDNKNYKRELHEIEQIETLEWSDPHQPIKFLRQKNVKLATLSSDFARFLRITKINQLFEKKWFDDQLVDCGPTPLEFNFILGIFLIRSTRWRHRHFFFQ